jgi:hypothetical protein
MKKTIATLFSIAALAAFSGCNADPGPDAISAHGDQGGGGTSGGCGCHSSAVGTRRQVLGTGGDFGANPTVTSHHVAGSADPADNQCTVCHDQSQHTSGTVRLRHADTGTTVVYNTSTPSTLEQFCLSCHDANGALATAVSGSALSPFNDGVMLGAMPYMASTMVASAWTGSSVHRSRGLTCAGTGNPATGCHGRNGAINAHGSVNQGLLTNTMNFQIPLVSASVYSANPLGDYNVNNYKLCFDCHASFPAVTREVVLGYMSGGVYDIKKAPSPYSTPAQSMQSLFRDRYIANVASYPVSWGGINQPFNDTMWGDPFLALHNYHLLGFEGNVLVDPTVNMLQWKYRGDPARIGRITCTACHSVHGTAAGTIRSTYVELGLQKDFALFPGYIPPTGDSYTSLDPFISTAIMTSFPLNCAVDCHGIQGQSSYWHTPNGE